MSLTDDARIDHVVVGYAEKVVDRFPVGSFDSSLRPVAAVAGPLGEEGDAVVCSYPGSSDKATCRVAVYRACEDGSSQLVHAVIVNIPREVVEGTRVTHMASQVDRKSGGIAFSLLTASSVVLSLNIPPRLHRSDSVWINRLASLSQRVTTVAGLTGPATSLTLLGPGWAAIGCADGNVTLAWLSTCDDGQETPSLCEKNLGLVARKSVWSKMTGMFRSSRSPSTVSAAVVGLVPLPNQELLSVTADGCCRRWSEPLSGYAGTPPASETNLEICGGIVVSNFYGEDLPGSLAVGRQDAAGAWIVSILEIDEDGSMTEGSSIDLPLQPGSDLLRLCIGDQQLLVVAQSPDNTVEILVGDISPENGGDGAVAGFTVCATSQQQGKRKLELARGVTVADLEDLRASHGGEAVSELCSLLPPPPFPVFYVADSCSNALSSRDFSVAWWTWTLISLGSESSPESIFAKLNAGKSVSAVHALARSLLPCIDAAGDEKRTAVGFVGNSFLVTTAHSVAALRPVDDLFEESLLRFGMGHFLACGGAEDLLLTDEEASDPQRLCSAALMAGALTVTNTTVLSALAAGHVESVVEACAAALNCDDAGLRMVGEASNQIRDLEGAAREVEVLIASTRHVPNEVLAGLAIWTEWALNNGALDSQCGAATVEEIRGLHEVVLGELHASLTLELAVDTSAVVLRCGTEGLTREELLKRLMEYPVDAKEVLIPLAILLRGGRAEGYVKARSILSDADSCTSEKLAYVLKLLTGVCVDAHGPLSSVLGSGGSLPQHCVRLCCQAGFFEAEVTFAKLQGIDVADLFDRALELHDWDTCLEALAERATPERLSAMARELERCGELGWLMGARTEKSAAEAATAEKLLDVIVSSARPESVRELEQLWAVLTKSGDREHAARLAIRGYIDYGGRVWMPEPPRGFLAADCTTPPGEIPYELRQPEVVELVENSEPEVVLSTLDRLQCQKKTLLLAKTSLKRMSSPRGVFVALRSGELAAEGSRFLFVDPAWVQLRLRYVSLYSAVVELTHVSVGAVDPWRLCRIGSSLGLLKPAVELARLGGLDPWSSCFLPFVELIRRNEGPALSREDGEPSLMRYAFTRFDSVSPLQCDGSITEALWSTLLLLANNDSYSLAHALVYLLRVEKSAVPEDLVTKLEELDWLALLRAYMVTGQLRQAADLALQQVDEWEPQSKKSPMDLALVLQVMEAVDVAVEQGDDELVSERDGLAEAVEGLRDRLRIEDERAVGLARLGPMSF